YFSMKLVEGGSLSDLLGRGGWTLRTRDDCRRAARLVADVARAVHYAHQRGILHRDLKPGNVLLEPAGAAPGDFTPRVTAFGRAKRLDQVTASPQTGALVGTPGYMAPEQAAGNHRDLTTAADVYGLGVILYELLTGRPPFKCDNVLDTLLQVREAKPQPPRSLNSRVDADLETICLKCLEKEPKQRYASAAALADDLQRFLDGEPVRARPVGRLERAWRWCRRNPVVAGLLGLVVLLLIAGTTVSALFAVAADAQARIAQDNAENAKDSARLAGEAETKAKEQAEAARQAERLARQSAYDSGMLLTQAAWEQHQ